MRKAVFEQNDSKFRQFKKSLADNNKYFKESPFSSMEQRIRSNSRMQVLEVSAQKKNININLEHIEEDSEESQPSSNDSDDEFDEHKKKI